MREYRNFVAEIMKAVVFVATTIFGCVTLLAIFGSGCIALATQFALPALFFLLTIVGMIILSMLRILSYIFRSQLFATIAGAIGLGAVIIGLGGFVTNYISKKVFDWPEHNTSVSHLEKKEEESSKEIENEINKFFKNGRVVAKIDPIKVILHSGLAVTTNFLSDRSIENTFGYKVYRDNCNRLMFYPK